MHSVLGDMLAMASRTGCLSALTLRTRMPLCTHLAYPEASLHSPCVPGGLDCESGPLKVSYVRQDCILGSVNLPVILYIRQPWFLIHSVLGEMLAMPSKSGCLSALTLRTRRPLLRSGPLNVSYVWEDCPPDSVILPVNLYIRQPCFLMHSVLGDMLAMPSKTGCPFALTLRTWGPSFCTQHC